jgi:hypothetical protein
MADNFAQIPPNSTGLKIDLSEVQRADGTFVERQRIVIADPSSAGILLGIVGKEPGPLDYGIIIKSADLQDIKELLFEILLALKEKAP